MTVTAHTRRGIPKEIESRRYLSAHHLPWNKNAALRMSRFDNNKMDDVYLFFTNQVCWLSFCLLFIDMDQCVVHKSCDVLQTLNFDILS